MSNAETVIIAMEQEHKKHRLSPVTKKALHNRTKESFSYRTLERILKHLVDEGKIVTKKRGKYWLPQYYKIHLLIAEPYADLFQYCESDEDWTLWKAFRDKMIQNKSKKLLEEGKQTELKQSLP